MSAGITEAGRINRPNISRISVKVCPSRMTGKDDSFHQRARARTRSQSRAACRFANPSNPSRCWPLARKDCPNTSHLNLGIIEPRASLTSRVVTRRANDDCPNSFREAPRRIARSRRYALSDTCRSSRNWLSLLPNRCAKRWTFRALRRVTLLQRERERDHRLSRQSNSSVISGPSRLTRRHSRAKENRGDCFAPRSPPAFTRKQA